MLVMFVFLLLIALDYVVKRRKRCLYRLQHRKCQIQVLKRQIPYLIVKKSTYFDNKMQNLTFSHLYLTTKG